jgi:hypothetical protein
MNADIARFGIAAIDTLLRLIVRIVGDTGGMVLLLIVTFLVYCTVLPGSSIRFFSILIFLSGLVGVTHGGILFAHPLLLRFRVAAPMR